MELTGQIVMQGNLVQHFSTQAEYPVLQGCPQTAS